MGDGTTEEKELVPRLLTFGGKQVDWRMWSRKFLARSNMRKYYEVLNGTLKMPPEPYDGTVESTEETKARLAKEDEVKNKNNIGYMELLMAMTEEISFAIVDEAKTDEFPQGDLAKAWKALLDTFEPSTAATKVMLKKQFYSNKLSDAERDPDEWITELELLRQRLKSLKVNVDDEDLVIHILNNLPKEYDSLVESIEEDLNKGADDEVTVKRVRERV
jgi:gag-polypeptide of LTR copia-type